jgi:hypothetical protein
VKKYNVRSGKIYTHRKIKNISLIKSNNYYYLYFKVYHKKLKVKSELNNTTILQRENKLMSDLNAGNTSFVAKIKIYSRQYVYELVTQPLTNICFKLVLLISSSCTWILYYKIIDKVHKNV